MVLNHYEMLGVEINATKAEIIDAYEKKKTEYKDELMLEKLRTAYYILTDDNRRKRYDRNKGFYKKISYRGIKGAGIKAMRFFLTVLDSICSFYWCFLFVIVIYAILYAFYNKIDFVTLIKSHTEEIVILLGLAAMDATLHFYIRRANRKLKNAYIEVKQ